MDGCWFSFSRSHPAREMFVFYLFGRVNILYTAREEGFYYKFLWRKKKKGRGENKNIKKCGKREKRLSWPRGGASAERDGGVAKV